jgi:hypothetical protein
MLLEWKVTKFFWTVVPELFTGQLESCLGYWWTNNVNELSACWLKTAIRCATYAEDKHKELGSLPYLIYYTSMWALTCYSLTWVFSLFFICNSSCYAIRLNKAHGHWRSADHSLVTSALESIDEICTEINVTEIWNYMHLLKISTIRHEAFLYIGRWR